MAGIWHQAGCCCGGPCTKCDRSGVVNVTTDAPAGCCQADANYGGSGGNRYDYEGYCTWIAGLAFLGTLHITYTIATGIWSAKIAFEYTVAWRYESADVDGISCDHATGYLQGEFTLPGIGACVGLTATCTLAGP